MSTQITIKELLARIKNNQPILILDVRDEEKYNTGTLVLENTENRNIPFVAMRDGEEKAVKHLASLPSDTRIVTVCTSGNKAQKAAAFLQEKGFHALSLEGGLTAWKENS